MASFPNIREAPGCECDVPLFGDVLREYAGTRKDGLRAADSPENANTLSPEVEVHIWSFKCLHDGSAGRSDYHQAAHLVEDIDEGQSIVALERHRSIHALLRRQHLSESVWELPGSDVNRHELRKESILEG